MTRIAKNEWKPQGIPDLEANASKALDTGETNILVTAGAGAGKTEFLAQKAAFLLQTQICPRPKRILAISFKRDAANTLKERVTLRAGEDLARRFDSFTFDRFTKSLWDRFRFTLPPPYNRPGTYKIITPAKKDFQTFLCRHRFDLDYVSLSKALKNTNLPILRGSTARIERAVAQYWLDTFLDSETPSLSFPMINRLVKYILTENLYILRALRATYPFVFLDEFQDTTEAQYDLLHMIFAQSDSVLTAVGDNKQRIMEWAGAMNHVFDRFVVDFSAEQITLQNNWRSHETLVHIQNVIATELEPQPLPVKAAGTQEIDGCAATIWQFQSEVKEKASIARWIQTEISTGRVQPEDIAILCRQQVNLLEPSFTELGIPIRNLARMIGDISIEEILTEVLPQLFIALLRLATMERSPDHWTQVVKTFYLIHAVNPDDEIGQQRIQAKLSQILQQLRETLKNNAPSPEAAIIIATKLLNVIEKKNLQQSYGEEADFNRVWNGFLKLLQESATLKATWSDVLDTFEGVGQIALMTIHKSKGLEFHTVIIYGFDNRYWKYFQLGNTEEMKNFFVAFTRAKQRVVITQYGYKCDSINQLSKKLNSAGVQTINIE